MKSIVFNELPVGAKFYLRDSKTACQFTKIEKYSIGNGFEQSGLIPITFNCKDDDGPYYVNPEQTCYLRN